MSGVPGSDSGLVESGGANLPNQGEVFPGGMVPDGTAGFIGKKFNMRMKKADMIDWEDIDPADYSIRVSSFSGHEMIQ